VKLKQQGQVALAVPVSERDHARGAADAPVTLVEYGDFECPYCERAYPIVKRLLAEMPGVLRVVFRHFPQNTIHANASVAAQAAEAAAAQGKFWEMHDILYEHQDELGEIEIVHFALRVGLEVYKFQADLAGEVYAKRVRADFRGGVRSGVHGTPAFFINGVRYEGKLEYEAMMNAVWAAAGIGRCAEGGCSVGWGRHEAGDRDVDAGSGVGR
jgi:protein-disulfide isomerase